jgi:hypothetical protein
MIHPLSRIRHLLFGIRPKTASSEVGSGGIYFAATRSIGKLRDTP